MTKEERDEKINDFIDQLLNDDILERISQEIFFQVDNEYLLTILLDNLDDETFEIIIRQNN